MSDYTTESTNMTFAATTKEGKTINGFSFTVTTRDKAKEIAYSATVDITGLNLPDVKIGAHDLNTILKRGCEALCYGIKYNEETVDTGEQNKDGAPIMRKKELPPTDKADFIQAINDFMTTAKEGRSKGKTTAAVLQKASLSDLYGALAAKLGITLEECAAKFGE